MDYFSSTRETCAFLKLKTIMLSHFKSITNRESHKAISIMRITAIPLNTILMLSKYVLSITSDTHPFTNEEDLLIPMLVVSQCRTARSVLIIFSQDHLKLEQYSHQAINNSDSTVTAYGQ